MSDARIIKNPSPLVLAILTLDEHFSNLNRLSKKIDTIDLKSNFDFEQSERLIHHFAEVGQGLSEDIVTLARLLNESRATAEESAQKVAVKAEKLKLRKDEVQVQFKRFQVLSDKVTQMNESLLEFRRPEGGALSDQEKLSLMERLEILSGDIQGLIEEAQVLQKVGQDSRIRSLEQNADSMKQSLLAVNQKIRTIVQ